MTLYTRLAVRGFIGPLSTLTLSLLSVPARAQAPAQPGAAAPAAVAPASPAAEPTPPAAPPPTVPVAQMPQPAAPAAEPAAAAAAAPPTAADATAAPPPPWYNNLKVSAFADAYYSINFNFPHPAAGTNTGVLVPGFGGNGAKPA